MDTLLPLAMGALFGETFNKMSVSTPERVCTREGSVMGVSPKVTVVSANALTGAGVDAAGVDVTDAVCA